MGRAGKDVTWRCGGQGPGATRQGEHEELVGGAVGPEWRPEHVL